MCLILNVEAPAEARGALELLAGPGAPGGLSLRVEQPSRWPWARPGPLRAWIFQEGGCACSMLTDHADPGNPTWDMRSEVLEPLARTLEAIGSAVPQGFTFAPLWAGDQPAEERVVSVREVSSLAREGRLGTRSSYRVAPNRASAV